MTRTSVVSGFVGYAILVLVSGILVKAVYGGWKGILLAAAAVIILLGIAAAGVKFRGFEFFALFGEWIESMTSDGKSGSRRRQRARRPHGTWTSKLIVAVGDQCEFPRCSKTRHLEVHHIDPYAGGGSNRLSNLIVVCPEHHKDFGAGAVNKTRQREYIRRENRFVDPDFPARWKTGVLAKERARQEDVGLGI